MTNRWTQHAGEEMAEPRVFAVQLLGGAGGSSTRYAAQQDRDERLFREAWFADFRARWRRDLYAQRIAFAVRMEGA